MADTVPEDVRELARKAVRSWMMDGSMLHEGLVERAIMADRSTRPTGREEVDPREFLTGDRLLELLSGFTGVEYLAPADRLRDKHFMDDETKARLPEAASDIIFLFRRERSEAADALLSERSRAEKAERERDEARSIVRDIYWMALRYADGRKSYAVGMCNDAVQKAYDGGWITPKDQGGDPITPRLARDGMSPEWQSIETRAEAETLRLRQALAAAEEALNGWRLIADNPPLDRKFLGASVGMLRPDGSPRPDNIWLIRGRHIDYAGGPANWTWNEAEGGGYGIRLSHWRELPTLPARQASEPSP